MSFNKWYMYIYTRMYNDITTHDHLQSMFHRILWHLCWVAIFFGSATPFYFMTKVISNFTTRQRHAEITLNNNIEIIYYLGYLGLGKTTSIWLSHSTSTGVITSSRKILCECAKANLCINGTPWTKKTYVSVSLPSLGPKNQAFSHYVYIPVTFIITMVPCWSTILRHPLKKAMVQYTVDMCWLLEVSKSW